MAIRIINHQKKIGLDLKRTKQSVSKVLKEAGVPAGEVNVLFTDDEGIREYNRDYLHRDRPTNVISFSLEEGQGDIVISVETALRDSEAGGLTLEQELDFLMIHGILHLLGYDHVKSKMEAARMKKKERELFFALNGFQIQ